MKQHAVSAITLGPGAEMGGLKAKGAKSKAKNEQTYCIGTLKITQPILHCIFMVKWFNQWDSSIPQQFDKK